ncbi:hypothetical protein Vretifemale_2863 [Volvox reticuliferus]|uniref:Glycosyltransferase n=1 Tax=Volvox reticuliferus TaxID=1737510 RepID=A0A8J4C158_9CHLO|nr:hypothetical protein Vretifemale_2863 [Volvox reticuliferus]
MHSSVISFVPIRPATRMEASPHLQRPVFSVCTLPVIMTTDWPYNMWEVFAQLASIADVYFRQKGMIDKLATLVLATPDDLGTTAFHHVLLSPYSKYPIISFGELSSRPFRDQRVQWSREGYHVSCFDQAVLCKLHGFPQGVMPTVQTILDQISPYLPEDPMEFGRSAPGTDSVPVSSDTTLRVLVEARAGPARNIKNLAEIMDACEEANRRGFHAGVFQRVSCKVLNTGDTPTLHGPERFYTTVASVRSAHVLVAVHGAGATNCFFMEAENGGTALLEIRPCGFGTKYCGWPDAYMQARLRDAGYPIRAFVYNVEDPQQCHPSDYEAQARSSPGGRPLAAGDDMLARDQHITLKPGPFMAMLAHVGSLLRNTSAWDDAQRRGRTHGYAVPEGLVLGPLCVKDMQAHLAQGATLIRA